MRIYIYIQNSTNTCLYIINIIMLICGLLITMGGLGLAIHNWLTQTVSCPPTPGQPKVAMGKSPRNGGV